MKKILAVLFLTLALSGCSNNLNTDKSATNSRANIAAPESQPAVSNLAAAPDKVEVFLFHKTQRCPTCVAIGKLADKTVQEKFAEEVNAGQVIFKEINIDLPENKELANKFQASGSSLYINTIKGGKDDIEQDVKVWMLTDNETEFINYLQNKLSTIINGNYGIN